MFWKRSIHPSTIWRCQKLWKLRLHWTTGALPHNSANIDLAVHKVNRNTEPCNLLRNGACLHDCTVILEWHVLFLCAIISTEDLYLHSGCWIPCCGWADRWWTGSLRPDPRWSLPRRVSVHPDRSRTAPQNRRPGRSTTPACGDWKDWVCESENLQESSS